MLGVAMDVDQGFLELTVDGRIDKEHYRQAVEAVDTLLKTHEKIDVCEIVKEVSWVEAEVWWKDLLFHLSHRDFLRRVAVVSDKGWVGPLTRFFAPLYPAAIRTYRMAELAEARQWAQSGDTIATDPEGEVKLDFA